MSKKSGPISTGSDLVCEQGDILPPKMGQGDVQQLEAINGLWTHHNLVVSKSVRLPDPGIH